MGNKTAEEIEWSDLYELNNMVSHGKITFRQACELYASKQIAEKDKENDRLKRIKLVHQLFIGKVADILRIEKVQELLKESNEALNK